MSEIMNTFFDRSRNDVTTAQEATGTTTIDVAQTGTIEPEDEAPSIEDAELTDAESADDTEFDDAADDDTADDDTADDDTASDIDDTGDDTGDEAVGAAEVTDEDGVAEPADAVDVAPAEPVAVAAAAEARPAAGTRGTTTVGDGIVSKVANMVARKVEGVYRLDDEDSSVTVDADVVTIRIALVVEYGHAVKALAEQVRTDVIDAVEQFLGLDVAAVDVHVSDIHLPEAV
jgi:uncharacterized alkaline shock family protein YloU